MILFAAAAFLAKATEIIKELIISTAIKGHGKGVQRQGRD